jgi:FkbM family methyltransferase
MGASQDRQIRRTGAPPGREDVVGSAGHRDAELACLLAVTRRLPRFRGSGVIGRKLLGLYQRKPRRPVTVDVLGMRMHLDPGEAVDAELLFYPQLYDHREVRFLREHLGPGDCFLDVGANVGFYSLVASRQVGPSGRVLAIEADPFNYEKLASNLRLNGADNVRALCLGVSDERETLRLGINSGGNRGGNSFLSDGPEGVLVECHPLAALLADQGVERVAGAKLDIEGFEFRVLDRFFSQADPAVHPRFLIVECNPTLAIGPGEDVLALLLERGYRVVESSRLNRILTRS